MNGAETDRSPEPRRIATLVDRLLGLADEPTDDDDLRLRKRVGVLAGYILVILPLQLPLLAQGVAAGWFVAVAMPLISAANLLVLASTRRFNRYVAVLLVMVLILPVVVEVALGGLAGSSGAIVFAFLSPVLALLALGPRSATAWFVAYVAVVIGVIVLDPVLSSTIEPQPYPLRLIWYAANLIVPLGLTLRDAALYRHPSTARRAALGGAAQQRHSSQHCGAPETGRAANRGTAPRDHRPLR
jgi:hypothetical protein